MIDIRNIKRFPIKQYKVFIPMEQFIPFENADNCKDLPLWLKGDNSYTVIPYSGPKDKIEEELLEFINNPYSGL